MRVNVIVTFDSLDVVRFPNPLLDSQVSWRIWLVSTKQAKNLQIEYFPQSISWYFSRLRIYKKQKMFSFLQFEWVLQPPQTYWICLKALRETERSPWAVLRDIAIYLPWFFPHKEYFLFRKKNIQRYCYLLALIFSTQRIFAF